MTWMRRAAVAAIGIGLVWAAATEEKFHTRLAPVSMDATMRATVAGVGSATATLCGAVTQRSAISSLWIRPASSYACAAAAAWRRLVRSACAAVMAADDQGLSRCCHPDGIPDRQRLLRQAQRPGETCLAAS